MKKNRYQAPQCVVTCIETTSMIAQSIDASGLDGVSMGKPGGASEADASEDLGYNIWDME